MTSRFQYLLVSDSDEDSSASDIKARRQQRNTVAQAVQPALSVASAPGAMNQSVESQKQASRAVPAQARVATVPVAAKKDSSPNVSPPLNQGLKPSKNFILESIPQGIDDYDDRLRSSIDATSISFRVDSVPFPGDQRASSRKQSINPSVVNTSFALSVQSDSKHSKPAPDVPSRASASSARNTPRISAESVDLPSARVESKTSMSFIDEGGPTRTGSQHVGATAEANTPRESAASLGSYRQNVKAPSRVRGRAGMDRSQRSDRTNNGELVRKTEYVIPPGRADVSALALTSLSTPEAPPPFRLSPRAQRAAQSRSSSRAATPAEGVRTPGNGMREVPPQIPFTRGDSKGISPKSERSARNAAATPHSARSQHADTSCVYPLPSLESPPAVRPPNRTGVPRSTADGPETPIEFRSITNVTAGTPNFQTDDTISFHFDLESSAAPQLTADQGYSHLHRRPQIPSPSSLDDAPTPLTVDKNGQLVPMRRAKVIETTTTDGRKVWMLYNPCRGDADTARAQEILPPPLKLSRRAQDILAAKRRVLEDGAMKRHLQDAKRHVGPDKQLSVSRRARHHLAFHSTAFYSDDVARRHSEEAARMQDDRWGAHVYDGMPLCSQTHRTSGITPSRWEKEKVIRTLQPVQVAPTGGTTGTCGCVTYEARHHDDALRSLIVDSFVREEGVRRYLNLQPMPLAHTEMQQMIDPPLDSLRHGSVSPSEVQTAAEDSRENDAEQRRLATLGGLWCTAETVREDGHLATRKDASAPRRVLRICGGQVHRVPLHEGGHETAGVRCYELLLFPRESLSPSAVNYGSEGLTLGQMIAPPASSFPLTPRIINDPMTLKEYKRRLLTTKSSQINIVNAEDDRATFSGASAACDARQYLTLTVATISPRQKNAIDLTLLMLPFRSAGIFDGKTVAEVPRFCAATVMSYRRLQGLSLSFSTKSAFMSAYKALLWATECAILDLCPADKEGCAVLDAAYSRLRLCATTSPLVPWVSSFGTGLPDQPGEGNFHGGCVDFAVLALAAQSGTAQATGLGERDPLMLEDFVITDADHNINEVDDSAPSVHNSTPANQQRRSSIFTNTLVSNQVVGGEWGGAYSGTDNVVGFTSFGVIRRAVSQKTSEVFDVRVMPRNRGRVAPVIRGDSSKTEEGRMTRHGQTARAQEEHLLQQDAEASILLEYVSRLPFQSRVHGVLVDDQRYYIFQEPWVSALSLEQSIAGSVEHDALLCNEVLKKMTSTTAVMSLKDFIHAVLHPGVCEREATVEVRTEIARVLVAQLLLLVTSLHGKGMLLGPCPPQRLLVRIVNTARDSPQTEKADDVDTPGTKANLPMGLTSSDIQLFVPDIGVNTVAWGYERQQCGVLEYLPPMYVLEHMLPDSTDKDHRPWTAHDDWWTFLTLCFELFSMDGSALVAPETIADNPTPTPTLTNFFSSVEILDVWQKVITDSSFDMLSTAAETIEMRTRRYVHQRVLKSVSRFVDTWVTTKAEEIEYFGTTAARRTRRPVRAVPPSSGTQGGSIGISLSAVYLKSAREVSDSSSIGLRTDEERPEERATANILADMQPLFQMRDFFDTILDAVFSPTFCSIHGPALLLLSHPFFYSLRMEEVFDGTYIYSAAVAAYASKHLRKSKVKAALLEYRTRAYRRPFRGPSDIPLVITSPAYTSGRASAGASLLLSSPSAFFDGHMARENGDSVLPQDPKVDPVGGLVLSYSNSMAPSATPSPREQSPVIGMWGRQRRKVMYDPEEWQSIAALEAEVRSALHSRAGPHDPGRSRQVSYGATHAITPDPLAYRTMQPERRDRGPAQVDTVVAASASGRGVSQESEYVVHSSTATVSPKRPRGSTEDPTSGNLRGAATLTTPQILLGKTGTSPLVQSSRPGLAYDRPRIRQRRSHLGVAPEATVESSVRIRKGVVPQRQRHRHTESSDLDSSFKDLGNNKRHHRRTSAATVSSHRPEDGCTGGITPRPLQSSQYSSRRSSKHSSIARQEEYNSQTSWPTGFPVTATVQRKGPPRRLSDQAKFDIDPMTIDQQTQRSIQSIGSHIHHDGSVEHIVSRKHSFQDSSSEESYILVPSDEETYTVRVPLSAHRSSGISCHSPAPCYPRTLHTEEIASNRNSYLDF